MPDAESRRRPVQLTAAAALVALEGLAALVFGVLEIGEIRLFRAVVGVGVALLMIGFAILLLAAARGLLRLRRWARGPVVALQLIIGLTGWSFRGGQTTPVAVVMIVVAALTLVLVLHPASTRALVGGTGAEPSA